MAPRPEEITGVVLAGGLGRRMSAERDGTSDKGLVRLAGRPLMAHVIDRIRPQVGALLINANGDSSRLADFGAPVIPDRLADHPGPLAGLHAAMHAAGTPWVLTVPCDTPMLPNDLAQRLARGLAQHDAKIAVARSHQRHHPVIMLAPRELLASLEAFLARGDRKIDLWYRAHPHVDVMFDSEDAFSNVNTPDELEALERFLDRARLDQATAALPTFDASALPVADAQTLIACLIDPVRESERLPVAQAAGRVLAEAVVSPIDVPAHDNAAMDGWALRWSDLAPSGTTRLTIAGTAYAGRPWRGVAGPGQTVRVMTGAVMPAGLDTVAMQEHCSVDGDATVTIPEGQQRGQHRRERGEDLAAGRIALHGGRLLSVADAGLIASLGLAHVRVKRRLRVAFLSTGDEVQSPGQALADGQIYDSNRCTIAGMLARLGVEAIDLGIVRDDPTALEAALCEAASRADAIVSSGGVSVGEADFTRELMARLGEVSFWTIAMRPGRPLAVGRVRGATYFGLPGNPVAVMVTFLFFARDALLRMAGATPRPIPRFAARSMQVLNKRPGRTEYQRGVLRTGADGMPEVALTGQQGSGVLRSMSEADCIIELGPEQGLIQPGDRVSVVPLTGLL